jgi:uncharacterized protein
MKIAIIGSGISGLACAHYLHKDADVTVFEAADRVGGHTATVDVALGGRRYAVDTGFIVFNDWTYPNFIELLNTVGVASQPTNMSFSMSDEYTGLEYAGSSVDTLFAQRSNLLSPRFLGMLKDIWRFNRSAVADLELGSVAADITLGAYLAKRGYGQAFIQDYLIPMGAAIWSAELATVADFPLQFFVRFFHNHGLLNITNRPQWRVIKGGSREYIEPLCRGFSDSIRTSSPVTSVSRGESTVALQVANSSLESFDHVVFACHSDQALAMLADPTDSERSVLSAIPYQANEVVLHTDTRLLPRNRKTWSSWNYQRSGTNQRPTLTYNMNILQELDSPEVFCVTLNDTGRINPCKIMGKFSYDHPVFTLKGMEAQQRWQEINGRNTWFCGAYWRNGFHEDGVVSAKRVAEELVRIRAAGRVSALPKVGSAA